MEAINKHKRMIIAATVLFCSLFFFYVRISQSPDSLFCIDEYSWLSRTYYFDLLVKGDLSNRLWDISGVDPDPKLTTYLYGALLYPKYISFTFQNNKTNMISYLIDNNYFNFFINKASYQFFRQKTTSDINNFDIRVLNINYKPINQLVSKYGNGFEKILGLLFNARIFASLFTALGVLVYFLLLIKVTRNTFISLLLAFAYGLSKVVYSAGTVAMTEPFFIFFTMICVFLLANTVKHAKSYKNALLFAVFSSFATQVKLSGCVFILVYLLFQCLFIIKNILDHKSIRRHVIFMVIVPIISIGIYYISDPSLYKQPIKSVTLQYTKTLDMGIKSIRKYPKSNILSLKKKLIYMYQFVQKRNVITPITHEKLSVAIFVFYIYGVIIGARKTALDVHNLFIGARKGISNETVFFISFNLLLMSTLVTTPLAADRYMVTFVGVIQYSVYLGISDLIRRIIWIYNSLLFHKS